MWRAYSSNSGKYSIGFDQGALDSVARSFFNPEDRGTGILSECLYIDPKRKDIHANFKWMIETMLPHFVNPPEDLTNSDPDDQLSVLRQTPTDIIEFISCQAVVAAGVKHIGFKGENEWRIILVDEDGSLKERTKFRYGNSMLVPYVEIDLKKKDFQKLIRRIVIGPTPHNDEATKAVEMLLDCQNMQIKSEDFPDGVEIVNSDIPYRDW